MATPSKGVFVDPSIKKTQGEAVSATTALQGYASVVLQQPDFDLKILENLSSHQKVAQGHANNWANTLQPAFDATNADIIDYANQFQAFYDKLRSFAKDLDNPDSKTSLIEGLKLLQDNIDGKMQAAETMSTQFQMFRKDLDGDEKNFLSDFGEAGQKVTGDKGVIKQLQDELAALHQGMKKDTDEMAGGAALIGIGAFTAFAGIVLEPITFGASTILVGGGAAEIAGGAVLRSSASDDYQKKLATLKDVHSNLAKDKAELASLTFIKQQIANFSSTFQEAVEAAQSLANYWTGLGREMKNIVDALERADKDVTSPFLVGELDQANRDWTDVIDRAKKLQPNGTSVIPAKFFDKIEDAFNNSSDA